MQEAAVCLILPPGLVPQVKFCGMLCYSNTNRHLHTYGKAVVAKGVIVGTETLALCLLQPSGLVLTTSVPLLLAGPC